MKYAFVSMLAIIVSVPGLLAQSASVAQISGTVQDTSGAAVPAAKVTVFQTDTGASRTTVSAADGGYVLPGLPIGPYRLEVTKEGFSTYVQSGIVLQVNTNPAVVAVLTVGSVSEQVVVSAEAAMVETHSNGVGQVIDSQRVVDLPLNGRNPTQLIALTGGATVAPTFQNLTSNKNYPGQIAISVAGGQFSGLSYLLDGASHNDPFNNLAMPLPFPDALQEFKVETSALPAQYGYHSAGAVNVVTKSGSNQFHGNAFEFVRNRVFNARNFFALTRDTLKRNQFGGTLGGPIVKNKLFFFGGFQGTIVKSTPNSPFAFMPTAQMLAGDFTAVTAPSCNSGRQITLNSPFVNNMISPSLFSAPALKMLTYYGAPPTDPCGRFQFGISDNSSEQMGVGKVDYQISTNHSMFVRYMAARSLVPGPYNGTQLISNGGRGDYMAQSLVLADTYIFGPNTLNSFRATFLRDADVRNSATPLFDAHDLGITNFTVLYPDAMVVNVANAFNSSFTGVGPGTNFLTTFQIADDVNLVRGSHQFGFGVNWIMPTQYATYNGLRGNFNFSGATTNLGLADFLLGKPSTFGQATDNRGNERDQYFALYVQDSWRVNARLKLNYGLRWEPFFGARLNDGQVVHFDETLFRQNVHSKIYPNAPAGVLYPGDAGFDLNNRAHRIKWDNFAPRIGMVWDPIGDGKTTVRASWGMFYDVAPTLFGFVVQNTPPWGQSVQLLNPAGGFADPWFGFPGGNPFPPNLGANAQFANAGYFQTQPLDLKNPYINQWNLSIQRQVGSSWLLSANYLGNNTVHLWTDQSLNPAVYLPGASCELQGVTYTPCSSTANTEARRRLTLMNPSQGKYIQFMENLDDGGTASYHALLLSAQHRFARNFTILGNYTWSHCIGDIITTFLSGPSYIDSSNRRFDRGNCTSADVRHNFNLSAVALAPKFSGRIWGRVASNWQLSVITSARTGSPFTVTTGVDNAMVGVNLTSVISQQRPNQVLASPYCVNKSKDCYVNRAAFEAPADGTFGNLGNNNLVGPGYFNVDIGLSRIFAITERQRLEIRGEVFNVQNRVNFNNPTTQAFPYGPSSVMTSPTFGRILSAVDPRIMQFAIKYAF